MLLKLRHTLTSLLQIQATVKKISYEQSSWIHFKPN